MSGVQFGQQIDMNNNKITELAPGSAGTDGVNVDQLTAASPQGYAQLIGDGTASSFNVTHGLNLANKDDFVARVSEVATGATYLTEVTSVDVDTLTVAFGFVPTSGQFRVSVVPVP